MVEATLGRARPDQADGAAFETHAGRFPGNRPAFAYPHHVRARTIGRRERLVGLAAIAAAFVVLTVALQLIRTPPAGDGVLPGPPAPSPTPTYTEQPIPEEARTSVYSSGVAASVVFFDATQNIDPTRSAPATNIYRVRAEEGVNVDPEAAASFVQRVLDDERGWAGYGRNNFRLVGTGAAQAAFTVTIASPATTDALCGADAGTAGLWSCFVDGQIVLNSDRWHFMVPGFANLDDYRAWLVNHHVGLYLGQAIAYCQAKGGPAPVMAQQERDLDGCLPNPWPRTS